MPVIRLRPRTLGALVILYSCCVMLVPRGAVAQELYGSVVGTVQDGSGAHIPGATIEIVNRETNLT